MPSLTISLTFRVELSASELNLTLKALDAYKPKEGSDEEPQTLGTRLREQKAAFTEQMLKQLGRGDPPAPR